MAVFGGYSLFLIQSLDIHQKLAVVFLDPDDPFFSKIINGQNP